MTQRRGAYGFVVEGMSADDWLVDAPSDWPVVSVTQERGTHDDAQDSIDYHSIVVPESSESRSVVRLVGGGYVDIDRSNRRIRYVTPSELSEAALIHPFLAPAATVLAAVEGWSTLHAGAFVTEGRAWIVTADRGGGKSTTLAALDELGYPVLADDLVVIRDGDVLAGPRSLDLREPGQFSAADDLGRVGERDRWRLRLGNVESQAPVGGIILLGWDEAVSVEQPEVSDRAKVLHEAASLPLTPRGLLRALAYPMLSIRRPKGDLADTVELVLDAIKSA